MASVLGWMTEVSMALSAADSPSPRSWVARFSPSARSSSACFWASAARMAACF